MSLRSLALLALPGTALASVRPFNVMTCSAGEPILTTASMTACEYQDVVNTVRYMWDSLSTSCTAAECQQASWAGCVLRMAGHDFMDYDPEKGRGADGCTNLDAPDNAGLQPCLEQGMFGKSLKDAYQKHCTKVSLADFIVIAGEAVMMATRGLVAGAPAVDFGSSFKFGRTTAKDCQGAGASLPDPEKGCDEVQRVFVTNMGLDWRGATALMGVHTLGRADTENSGYDGWWTPPEDARRFNNAYYTNMIMNGWMSDRAVNGNDGKNQWRRSDAQKPGFGPERQMMLNTDICLAYNNNQPGEGYNANAKVDECCAWALQSAVAGIPGDYCGTVGELSNEDVQVRVCCDGRDPGDCGEPDGSNALAFDAVKEFAANDGAWIAAFRQAWTKATENGFTTLRPLLPCDGAATTASPASTTPSPGSTTPCGSASSSPPGPVVDGMVLDCAADFADWERSWSEIQKSWCCQHTGKGCVGGQPPITGPPGHGGGYPVPDGPPGHGGGKGISFDCSADFGTWQRAWSEDMQQWCCQNTGKGCPGTFYG